MVDSECRWRGSSVENDNTFSVRLPPHPITDEKLHVHRREPKVGVNGTEHLLISRWDNLYLQVRWITSPASHEDTFSANVKVEYPSIKCWRSIECILLSKGKLSR